MSIPSPLSTRDGVFAGLLTVSTPDLIIDALWPSNASSLTQTGANEDLQFVA